MSIRPCRVDERAAILRTINAAAEVYRSVIPPDCWHEPYMPRGELASEIAAGVSFWGYEAASGSSTWWHTMSALKSMPNGRESRPSCPRQGSALRCSCRRSSPRDPLHAEAPA